MGGDPLLDLVRLQVELGPRVPGSPAHRRLEEEILRRLAGQADAVHAQRFPLTLAGSTVECANLAGLFRARGAPEGGPAQAPLLLGTHYDTRLIADRERDPGRRARPIPGANDGGSGTAVLLHLLPFFRGLSLERDLLVVFFDAEDVGGLDGNPFAAGAERFAADFPGEQLRAQRPDEAIVLDMVGGRGLVLDVDASSMLHPPSRLLTGRVFEAGLRGGHPAFLRCREKPPRWIVSDHFPFLRRGTAACLLIDLDYPEWHTQRDLPEAMSGEALESIAAALRRFFEPPAG